MLQSLFYLTIALHVLGIIVTHLQEHKPAVTTASGDRYTVLLSVVIVEEMELISVTPYCLLSVAIVEELELISVPTLPR
jgi:hypothetical protein